MTAAFQPSRVHKPGCWGPLRPGAFGRGPCCLAAAPWRMQSAQEQRADGWREEGAVAVLAGLPRGSGLPKSCTAQHSHVPGLPCGLTRVAAHGAGSLARLRRLLATHASPSGPQYQDGLDGVVVPDYWTCSLVRSTGRRWVSVGLSMVEGKCMFVAALTHQPSRPVRPFGGGGGVGRCTHIQVRVHPERWATSILRQVTEETRPNHRQTEQTRDGGWRGGRRRGSSGSWYPRTYPIPTNGEREKVETRGRTQARTHALDRPCPILSH